MFIITPTNLGWRVSVLLFSSLTALLLLLLTCWNIFNQFQKLFSRIFLIKFCNVCNAMFIIANIDAIKNSTSPLSSLSKQEAAPCPHLGSQEEEKHWKRVAFSSPPTEPGNIVFINFMFPLFSLFAFSSPPPTAPGNIFFRPWAFWYYHVVQIKLFVFPQEYSVSEFSRIFENACFPDLLDFVRLKVISDFVGERDYLSFVFPPGLPHSEHLEKFRLGIYVS